MSSLRTTATKHDAHRRTRQRTSRPEAAVAAGSESSNHAKRLAAEINRSLADGHSDVLTPEALQALMAATCRLYSAQAEAGAQHLPLGTRSGVTATDVMNVSSGLLKAVNLAVFELGMWQSWTGR
jgi:hypothetical protein